MLFRRIASLLIYAFLAGLLLSGCQNNGSACTGDGWGNTAGNIKEAGLLAVDGSDWYFYISGSEAGLYHMDKAGTITQLRRGNAYNLNVVDGRIYFLDGLPGHICSISTDGSGFKVVRRDLCQNLYVNPSCMVYLHAGTLYVADRSGRAPRALASHVLNFVPYGDTLVFAQYRTEQDGLYQVNLDGSNLVCLTEEVPMGLTSNGEYIYYSVSNDKSRFGAAGGRVYQVDETGETVQLAVEDECWNMNATQDYIFYRNQTALGGLYRMDLDGSNAVCLQEEDCGDINVVGDLILFRVVTVTKGVKKSGLYIITTDGNNLYFLTEPEVFSAVLDF